MSDLTFYFDPACPWAWRTALWVREVRQMQPLQVQWRILSLTEIHRGDDPLAAEQPPTDPVMRVLVQARRQGGNEAVERLYLALGRARHERRENLKNEGVVEAALEEAGLPRALLRQALDDSSTEHEALAEHREAVEKFGAFGVPWMVLEGQSFGLFGPVLSEVPRGEAALQMWEHVSWLLTQPDFYELKRARA